MKKQPSAIHAAITGVHGYVPDYILSNDNLATMVATNDEWITTRTGIKTRHILQAPDKGTSDLAIPAVLGLLEKTKTDAKEIDLIICATITPDMPTPAAANLIAHGVGAINAFSYDLQAACSGFLYALVTAAQFIESGNYNKVIVVGADKMSSIVDYEDRATCILFGDGAGAVLLEPSKDSAIGIRSSILRGDGLGAQHLHIKAGGSRKPASATTLSTKEHYIYQEGNIVYKYAVEKMSEVVLELMQQSDLQPKDIKFLVPHQANKRILESVAQRTGFSEAQVMLTIQEFGNTTDATIPLCLWRYEPQLQKGDKIIITTFGGGFTWGATYLTWAYGA